MLYLTGGESKRCFRLLTLSELGSAACSAVLISVLVIVPVVLKLRTNTHRGWHPSLQIACSWKWLVLRDAKGNMMGKNEHYRAHWTEGSVAILSKWLTQTYDWTNNPSYSERNSWKYEKVGNCKTLLTIFSERILEQQWWHQGELSKQEQWCDINETFSKDKGKPRAGTIGCANTAESSMHGWWITACNKPSANHFRLLQKMNVMSGYMNRSAICEMCEIILPLCLVLKAAAQILRPAPGTALHRGCGAAKSNEFAVRPVKTTWGKPGWNRRGLHNWKCSQIRQEKEKTWFSRCCGWIRAAELQKGNSG